MQQVRAQLTVLSKSGEVLHYQEYDMNTPTTMPQTQQPPDPFQQVLGNGLARVSTTYQRAMKYGEEKVVVTISCACNQDEATINATAALAFNKAAWLTDWAYGMLLQNAQQQPQQPPR